MAERKPIEAWLTDMDGVLIHEGTPIPGAGEFIGKLRESGKPFLVLTNNSIYTQRDLRRWPPPSSSAPSGRAAPPT